MTAADLTVFSIGYPPNASRTTTELGWSMQPDRDRDCPRGQVHENRSSHEQHGQERRAPSSMSCC